MKEGEVDFLVFDPTGGFVGLEVKGGNVTRTPDGWLQQGKADPKRIQDPGVQAQRGVHALHGYLCKEARLRSSRERLRFGFGVVFPDVDVHTSLGPDLPRAAILDRLDMADPLAALTRLFQAQCIPGPRLGDGIVKRSMHGLATASSSGASTRSPQPAAL